MFDTFCREVARGTANLILIFDSQRVVIGGGLTSIGAPLRDGIDKWLQKLLLGQANRPIIEVALAELGEDASTLGAALMSLDLPLRT